MANQFVEILKDWYELVDEDFSEEFAEAYQLAQSRQARIEEHAKKLIGIVKQRRESVETQVREFVQRHHSLLHQAIATKGSEVVTTICERVLTGLGVLMRQQIPREHRSESHTLAVNWLIEGAQAEWVGVDAKFLMRNAIQHTAEHLAGADAAFAALVARPMLSDIRENLLSIPHLSLIEEDGQVSTYEWGSSLVTETDANDDDEEVGGGQPFETDSPVEDFFRDQQFQWDQERELCPAAVWDDAQYLVCTRKTTDKILADKVNALVTNCVSWTGVEPLEMIEMIRSPVFAKLCTSVDVGNVVSTERLAQIVRCLNDAAADLRQG